MSDPQPSNSPILRILAGILGVMMLANMMFMVFEFFYGHLSASIFRAICQLIFAYVCIAYALGDPLGSMIGDRNRQKASKDSSE